MREAIANALSNVAAENIDEESDNEAHSVRLNDSIKCVCKNSINFRPNSEEQAY